MVLRHYEHSGLVTPSPFRSINLIHSAPADSLALRIQCFQRKRLRNARYRFRSTKQILPALAKIVDFLGSTKHVLQALSSSQTSRKQAFERWLFWLDETRTSSAFSFSGTTNTVVSAPWCISLDKYNTFGPGERSAGGFRAPKPLRVQCQTFFMKR